MKAKRKMDFESWWLSWSTEPECGLDNFSIDEQAMIVDFCKRAFAAGQASMDNVK